MATYIAGPTGAGIEDGSDWDNRLAGLNAVEDVPVVPGDVAHFGPGVYREQLTVDVSGGNTYIVGTVGVTNGSKQVDGNGTAWVANVAADYMFHIAIYASGNDGVANGTATFTSAAGNFQANMIGKVIQISARGAYVIGAVAAANSITLTDPNGLGWPGAGGGLTYSVMSGEGHYDIDSVDDNTTIQLKQPWNGPTLTVLAYITFNPIRYVADVTGEHTNGVGGVVRITGSDNDQTRTRNNGIDAAERDYRIFRGFRIDLCADKGIRIHNGENWVIEDCNFEGNVRNIAVSGADQADSTFRRCVHYGGGVSSSFEFWNNVTVDDTSQLIENNLFLGNQHFNPAIGSTKVGGITICGCTFFGISRAVLIQAALAVGQTILVENCIPASLHFALEATVLGEIVEDFNTFWNNPTDRINVAVGANSITLPPLFELPLLYSGAGQISGFKFPWLLGGLSEWSQVRAIAGAFEAYGDLHGIPRPVTASKRSWGASQFVDMEVESGTVQAGTYARVLHDAGQVLARRIPVTGAEITVTMYMRFEADYEPDPASLPRMIIKQPGQADQITTMTVAANNWEQLSDTFTPASPPGFVEVWAESRNSAAAGNYKVFYDTMGVS